MLPSSILLLSVSSSKTTASSALSTNLLRYSRTLATNPRNNMTSVFIFEFYLIYLLLSVIIGTKIISEAAPSASSVASARLREVALKNMAESTTTSLVANLTRQHEGDVFIANGMSSCNMDTCVGLSSGTAGLFVSDTRQTDTVSNQGLDLDSNTCECRCLPYLNTYREDLEICVDDIHECTLSPFISGSSSEKIPFVFLPLRGQIIHPSREISFPGVRTPICAVTGSQYLTEKGWSDLRNPIDTDFPFRLFRDEGRTFLQWLGESDLRQKMQGRLILVHMMCRDMSSTTAATEKTKNQPTDIAANKAKDLFTPCVAFRVNGSPVKYVNNVSEVLFQSEITANLSTPTEGLSAKEYIVIGVCSLLLGLIYVASVFLYLHVKKRKNQLSDAMASIADLKNEINYPKNDQVSFGAPFTRSGSVYGSENMIDSNRNSQRHHRNSLGGSTGTLNGEESGIVKNNPLLKHYPNLSDHSGFMSDLSNSNSECEETHSAIVEKTKNMQTSALVHPLCDNGFSNRNCGMEAPPSPTQENECLPEENVSITEDMTSDEKLENMRAIVNGTVRKKLYFNPAYFEPHLLLSPPPAAIEFLTKIREVIAIAKYKMSTKRFQPSLNIIHEEYQGSDMNTRSQQNTLKAQTNSFSKRRNCSGCTGCPGCIDEHNTTSCHEGQGKCNNCGDKRNSIQKWLEGVPMHNQQAAIQNEEKDPKQESITNVNNKKNEETKTLPKPESRSTKPDDAPSSKKRKAPALPTTTPKIISHSLKSHVPRNVITDNTTPNLSKSVNASQITNEDDSSQYKQFDKNEIYNKLAKSGSEIYNNPRFNLHDSPQLSQRSKTSSSQKSRSSRKRIEVLDQYANPANTERSHYEMLRSIKHMPDMVYEAIAKDYSYRNFTNDRPLQSQLNIPIPDYEGIYHKNVSAQGSDPYVPTPDYSTLGKKYQPDSPIYRRKSPQYLIVDYETDSLERTSTVKKKSLNAESASSSNTSSDASSQPSPSLSTALPLEEEVEVHHTVYDKVEGFRKDGDITIKKSVIVPREYEDIRTAKNLLTSPIIKYDTPYRGSMTIEVEHDPESDLDVSTDSDQFEPDTLDRKPKKHISSKNMNAWSEHLKRSKNFVENDDTTNYSSLENMTSLPDFNQKQIYNDQFVLRSSNSFRSQTQSCGVPPRYKGPGSPTAIKPTFGSLREIYQSKTQKQMQRTKLTSLDFTDQGRILTLEAKHSRRQRKDIDSTTLKKIMPPDVIPSESNYYDLPKQPQDIVDDHNFRKNFTGWNSDDFNKNSDILNEDTDIYDTASNNSESTEITGVSDTQVNSEFENDKKKLRNDFNSSSSKRKSAIFNNNNPHRAGPSAISSTATTNGDIYSAKIDRSSSTNSRSRKSSFHIKAQKSIEDADKIEILSTSSLSNRSVKLAGIEPGKNHVNSSGSPSLNCSNLLNDRSHHHNVQTIYRVEVTPPTNGMQIALGLKCQAKKSKDLKNAWKKFISMATSKFNNNNNNNPTNSNQLDKLSTLSDSFDRDEGISSLIDDKRRIFNLAYPEGNGGSWDNGRDGKEHHHSAINNRKLGIARSNSTCTHQYRSGRHDQDSGYISGDSHESKAHSRRVYERYNFKSMTGKDNITEVESNNDTDTGDDDADAERTIAINSTGSKHNSMSGRRRDKYSDDHYQNQENINENNNNNNFKFGYPNPPIQVNVYSSDDEPYNSSPFLSSESDGEGNADDMCESGAESVETHSVLYKNIRNIHYS